MKKYKLTSTTKKYSSSVLYQIEALKDFGDVKKGERGGFIQKEDNLSQNGNAWVSGNAEVFGNAWVSGDAKVYGNARVFGDAEVYGDARVFGDAEVFGDAKVSGKLKLIGGYFYYTKEKSEEINKISINENYELLANNPVIEEEGSKKQELLDKAQELIDKANELKEKAGEL